MSVVVHASRIREKREKRYIKWLAKEAREKRMCGKRVVCTVKEVSNLKPLSLPMRREEENQCKRRGNAGIVCTVDAQTRKHLEGVDIGIEVGPSVRHLSIVGDLPAILGVNGLPVSDD